MSGMHYASVPSTVPPEDYARRIKSLRGVRELTQGQLAELIGVSYATVNRWENELRDFWDAGIRGPDFVWAERTGAGSVQQVPGRLRQRTRNGPRAAAPRSSSGRGAAGGGEPSAWKRRAGARHRSSIRCTG